MKMIIIYNYINCITILPHRTVKFLLFEPLHGNRVLYGYYSISTIVLGEMVILLCFSTVTVITVVDPTLFLLRIMLNSTPVPPTFIPALKRYSKPLNEDH